MLWLKLNGRVLDRYSTSTCHDDGDDDTDNTDNLSVSTVLYIMYLLTCTSIYLVAITTRYTITRRVGLLDIDFNMHKNNATFLRDCELSRWNWTMRRYVQCRLLSHNFV